MHVATPPETHSVCPWLHVLLHVSEQPASGAVPEHTCGDAHIIGVPLTYRQLSESVAHVASVDELSQTGPVTVQTEPLHVHAPDPADPVHT